MNETLNLEKEKSNNYVIGSNGLVKKENQELIESLSKIKFFLEALRNEI